MPSPIGRRAFLTAMGSAALGGACRSRAERGPIVLRLSHSMSAGPTSLHVFGDKFRELAEAATGGAVRVRIFPSGTLGQEREVVQQLQEGMVDFWYRAPHLGQRRAPAAGLRLSVSLARLGSRPRGRRRPRRA